MVRKYRRTRGGFRYGRKTGKRVSTPGERLIGKNYRRKGIATALKHIGLSWAKNTHYDKIRTNNVSTNSGMLHINTSAGFKFLPGWIIFEKKLNN